MLFRKKDICSIVVTYKPSKKILNNIFLQFKKNFSFTIIVDNTSSAAKNNFSNFKNNKNFLIIKNNVNHGLSIALNQGIKKAKSLGFSMVALFDQDTKIDSDFNNQMIININSIRNLSRFSLFSQGCYDLNTNRFLSLYKIKFLSISRGIYTNLSDSFQPDFVITSGSYIPIKIFDNVGFMDESLFINYIDIEWCLRSRSKGYQIVCFSNCHIKHFIGDYSISIFNQHYPIHSPLRMYYTFRNSIYIYSLSHISFSWKVIDFFRNFLRFLFYMLFVKNRWTFFKYITKGYYHGLIKKMGKLEE